MKLLFLTAFSLMAATIGHPTLAQDNTTAPPDIRCWYASKSFTQGSAVTQGGMLKLCLPTGAWADTSEGASDCLYDDSFYGVGSLEEVDGTLLECQPSGTWVPRSN